MTRRRGGDVGVAGDGKYATVPLRKDVLRVTAVQSPLRAVRDTSNKSSDGMVTLYAC
jgi:hypothetical protein